MAEIEIIPATLAHMQEIGRIMNDEDRREIEDAGLKSHRALWRGWKNSLMRYTAIVDGQIAACWGVEGGMMGGVGVPWLVTSRKAREISPHIFARIYRAEVRKMLEMYDTLVNYVDARYDGAVRMLQVAGFSVDEPKPLYKLRRMYRRFMKEA